MINSLFFFLFLLFASFSLAEDTKSCGLSGTLIERIENCKKIFPEKNMISGLQLVSSTEEGQFLFDPDEKLVWSPTYQSKADKCKRPYRKAKIRHYKKLKNKFYKRVKGSFHCISRLKDYVLIPDNRYLYFE